MANADSKPPVRVGLIGAGKMGMHHLKAIKASGCATVVGLADPAASDEDLRPLLPADAIIVGDAAEMLQRVRPDVVHIVTPPGSHAALAELALNAGCHVYIEKPFTSTRAEAERILDLAAERGLKVCAGHQVLFESPALAALEALPEVGRVVHIESCFAFKMVRKNITASEQVKDILPHAVYPVVEQLRAGTGLLDEPIQVQGLTVDAEGEARALLRLGSATAGVIVTLNGRPVEQYQNIIGTNGSLRPDYIGGGMAKLVGPGTGPGVLLTPFRRSFRTLTGSVSGVTRLVVGGSYPGLRLIVRRFYESIREGGPSPVSPRSILDTVGVCEHIGGVLDAVEREYEATAQSRLQAQESSMSPADPSKSTVLVTGGTGLLGRRVAEELRHSGFPVTVMGRRVPVPSKRLPGVSYVACDLGRGVDASLLKGVGAVVHAAAETAGGKADHQRNSIDATRLLIEAAANAGVKDFIHISSIAVLKTSRELGHDLDESSPVDLGSLRRGPYVWGKAESEVVAQRRGTELGLRVKVIRPGPLVDYSAFNPPGRLGRELGPLFVAIGPKHGALSVCDVTTAARVIRSYLEAFEQAPPMLNLVESPPPTRLTLLKRYTSGRPDLSTFWFPSWLLRALSGPLKLVQRVALGSAQPIDVAAAFASERYKTDLAGQAIQRAGRSGDASA